MEAELQPEPERSPEEIEEELGLSDRQLNALNKLYELGGAPRKTTDEPYSSNHQIRALQLIYEDRFAGPGRNQGRKRQPRAAEEVARQIRNKSKKIIDAIDDALDPDENINVRLKAADMALKIEREEASLQLKEEDREIDKSDREQLIGTLIALIEQPHTAAALEGAVTSYGEEIPEVEVIEEKTGNGSGIGATGSSEKKASRRSKTSANSVKAGAGRRSSSRNGPKSTARRSGEGPNPFTKTARRRTTNG